MISNLSALNLSLSSSLQCRILLTLRLPGVTSGPSSFCSFLDNLFYQRLNCIPLCWYLWLLSRSVASTELLDMHISLLVVALPVALLGFASAEEDSVYAPVTAECAGVLVRDAAKGIAAPEGDWVQARKEKADKALADWLKKANPDFDTSKLPTVALAHSGGGYRAMLSGAGLVSILGASHTQSTRCRGQ